MKFTRFELSSAPGFARTGIAYEGRFYETDGTNAIGIHEASDVRLLAPVGRPSSVRIYRPGELVFDYANPGSMLGPNEILPKPARAERLGYVPCVGIVVGGAGEKVETHEADDVVLGLTLGHCFSTLRDHGGRALDAGFSAGPAIVTPDELIDTSIRLEGGLRYEDSIAVRYNGVEIARFELAELPHTMAQVLAHASDSGVVREGDLILVPLGDLAQPLDSGDEIALSGAKIGTLVTRIG